jgi:Rrf2 family protein
MISQTAEYALRAMAYLADQMSHGHRSTIEVATVTKVPTPYLSKVLKRMVDTGLLRAQRGPGGGFQLKRTPELITVWDVVDAVEPVKRITTCPLELGAHAKGLCPLHRKLDNALAQLEKAFRETTLADLINQPGTPQPLCDFVNSQRLPLN